MELYVHIPFCIQKCRYCDFASWPDTGDRMASYVDLVLKEAEEQKKWMEGPAETVYFGGGTPSLLSPSLFRRLCGGLRDILGFAPEAEITSEANPGTVRGAWLDAALEAGVNRLSLGVQAAQDRLLVLLGRIHRSQEAVRTVAMARKAGITNLSLDLMFGLPEQTEADWKETLAFALDLNPEHISAYGLIPEEGTPLEADLRSGKLQLPSPETERRMYDTLKSTLRGSGYEPYEVSNFARPGYRCRHNLGYWKQVPYLGLGVSAASMAGMKKENPGISYLRFTNPRDYESYRNAVENPTGYERETVPVSAAEARFETMMLGLRLYEGVDERAFFRMHGLTPEDWRGNILRSLQSRGLLEHKEGRWYLTDRGMDIQNPVLVELMD